jgi:hypothetical protein
MFVKEEFIVKLCRNCLIIKIIFIYAGHYSLFLKTFFVRIWYLYGRAELFWCQHENGLVHPFHYSPSCAIPLLKMASIGFSVPYSYLYRKYINYFCSRLYPPPSTIALPLTWHILYSCLSFFKCPLVHFALVFYILPINILYLSLFNPLYYSSLPFSL